MSGFTKRSKDGEKNSTVYTDRKKTKVESVFREGLGDFWCGPLEK